MNARRGSSEWFCGGLFSDSAGYFGTMQHMNKVEMSQYYVVIVWVVKAIVGGWSKGWWWVGMRGASVGIMRVVVV